MALRGARRFLLLAVAAMALVGAGASWWVGSELVRPAQHRVALPPDFPARALTIQGSGRTIAAWWVDRGERAPAVLLLHAIRADRLSMVARARLLARHGFSVLLIDLQAHGETLDRRSRSAGASLPMRDQRSRGFATSVRPVESA